MIEVTLTVTSQYPKTAPTFAGTVPPMIDKVVPMVVMELPAQVVAGLAGLAKVTPAGSVSVRAAGTVDNVKGKEFGLVIVIVNTELLPAPIELGVKKLLICAGNEVSDCA
jgi:hypothetical protein